MRGHRVRLEDGVPSQEAQAARQHSPKGFGEAASARRWGLGQRTGRPVVGKPHDTC